MIACIYTRAQFSDSTTRHIALSLSGIVNRTNESSSYVLNNNLRFGIRRKDVSLNAAAGWIYGKQDEDLSNNDFNASLDFNLYKTFEHFYYWGLATFEKSRSLKINDRSQIGLGVAYNFVDTKKLFINLSEGLLFERSDININDTLREIKSIVRNSLRLRYRLAIGELLSFDGTHFLQNALGDSEDYIFRSNNSLRLRLTQWLNIAASLTYNRVNKTDRENLLLTYGITMEKYF